MSSACLGVEEKSLFGGDGLSLEKKLFYKSSKNKAPAKVGLSVSLCSVVSYVELRNEAAVAGLFSGTLG